MARGNFRDRRMPDLAEVNRFNPAALFIYSSLRSFCSRAVALALSQFRPATPRQDLRGTDIRRASSRRGSGQAEEAAEEGEKKGRKEEEEEEDEEEEERGDSDRRRKGDRRGQRGRRAKGRLAASDKHTVGGPLAAT